MNNNFFITSGDAILASWCSLIGTTWTLIPSEGQIFSMKTACEFILLTPEHLEYTITEAYTHAR